MKILSPEAIKIWRIEDDTLVMKIEGRKLFLGPPRRALPISDPGHWIALSDSDGQEIGILPSLEGLPEEARELLSEALNGEYTLERITRIIKVDREPLTGQTHWRVELAPSDQENAAIIESAPVETSLAKSILTTDLKTLVKSSSNGNGPANGTSRGASSDDSGEKNGTLSKVTNRILNRDKSDEEPSHLEREFTISGQEDVAVARYPQIFIVDTERRRYEIPNCDALDLESRRAADRFF